jgi:hypothetical protein
LPFEKAVVWSLLGGNMLLPSALIIDVPVLPPLDKDSITGLATLLLCWMYGGNVPQPRRSMALYFFAAALVISPLLSSINNSYELQTGGKSVQGFYPFTALKFAGRNMLMLVPMYIGSRFLATDNGRAALLKAIPTALLFYSPAMLFEVRMSPQLHRWVYGYFPHSFVQQMRDGGFRPVVFMSHGLEVALFTALGLLATVVLLRKRERILQIPPGLVAAYFSGLLILCKSLGATIYAIVLAPVILLTRPRFWAGIALIASLVVCIYPLLRSNDLAPTQLVTNAAGVFSSDRQASFQMRIDNEKALLAKANQKPLFGWGGWGRNRIFDKWTGQDISVTDGGWIIQYGCYGWAGYLALFGLLTVALLQAFRAIDKEVTPANITRGGLALLVGMYVIDSIPNSTQLAIIFPLAGAVASSARARRGAHARRAATAPQASPPGAAAVAR